MLARWCFDLGQVGFDLSPATFDLLLVGSVEFDLVPIGIHLGPFWFAMKLSTYIMIS